MRYLLQTIIYAFTVISFIACEPKPNEVTVTFHRDTVINGGKAQMIVKRGRARRLTRRELDSVNEMVKNAESLTRHYVPGITNEDTVVYLDRLITYWRQDSSGNKIAKEEIYKAAAIQFGQTLVDNNNFEWRFIEGELMIEEKHDFGAELPYEISEKIINRRDSLSFEETRNRIVRDVKIVSQLF